jgi:hypothetical protein
MPSGIVGRFTPSPRGTGFRLDGAPCPCYGLGVGLLVPRLPKYLSLPRAGLNRLAIIRDVDRTGMPAEVASVAYSCTERLGVIRV